MSNKIPSNQQDRFQILLASAKQAAWTLGDIYNAELAVGNDDHDDVLEMKQVLDQLDDAIALANLDQA